MKNVYLTIGHTFVADSSSWQFILIFDSRTLYLRASCQETFVHELRGIKTRLHRDWVPTCAPSVCSRHSRESQQLVLCPAENHFASWRIIEIWCTVEVDVANHQNRHYLDREAKVQVWATGWMPIFGQIIELIYLFQKPVCSKAKANSGFFFQCRSLSYRLALLNNKSRRARPSPGSND